MREAVLAAAQEGLRSDGRSILAISRDTGIHADTLYAVRNAPEKLGTLRIAAIAEALGHRLEVRVHRTDTVDRRTTVRAAAAAAVGTVAGLECAA